jgi:hypothetical protein
MSFFLEVKHGKFWIRTVYEYDSQSVAIKQLEAIRKEATTQAKNEFRMVMVTHDEAVMEW